MAMVNMTNLLNGKDSRWLQLEVCREFQRNKCTRQDTECKFAHPPVNVEVQNGKVTACYDSIKGRCNRDKPPCKYFHPPQHLKDQLLINGRNHLALKNAIMQQMGIPAGQQVLQGQISAVGGNPYITSIPATYSPYFATGHLVPTLLGPDPTQIGQVVPAAVPVAQQKIPRSDRLEATSVTGQVLTQSAAAVAASAAMAAAAQSQQPPTHTSIPNPAGAVAAHAALEFGKKRSAENDIFQNMAFSGMLPFKRPATDKSGMPVYPPGTATTYQQLMQLQHPFVPVSCEYQTATSISTTQASQPQYLPSTTTSNAVVNPIANSNNLNNNIMSIKNNNINSNPSEIFTTSATTCSANAVAGNSSTTNTTSLTTFPSSVTSSNNSVENNIKNLVNVNVPVKLASNINCSSNSNDNINVNGGVKRSGQETTNIDTTTINTNGTSNTNDLSNSTTSVTIQESAVNVASSTSSTITVEQSIPTNAFDSLDYAGDHNNTNNNNNNNNGVVVSSNIENSAAVQQASSPPSHSLSHYQSAIFPYALPTSQITSLPQQQMTTAATYSYPQNALAAAAYTNYYQDPATIAKEVAHKNYAFKLASSNAFTGKTLAAYASIAAINKPLMAPQYAPTPNGLRAATPNVAAPQTISNHFAQRQAPISANYYQQIQTAQAQYLRPQMNPYAAAAAAAVQQQLLIPHQQHIQPHFFQYPGVPIPSVTTNAYAYGLPMSAATAVQTSNPQITQVSSMQQSQTTSNSSVVLNPYKKMKTS